MAGGVDSRPAVIDVVRTARRWFLDVAAPEKRPSPAALCVFPDLGSEGSQLILEVQRALKSEFVADGLMLGQFFPGYDAPGLHNPRFHALTSPVPLLVIRPMVAADLVFLTDQSEWLQEHARRFPTPHRTPTTSTRGSTPSKASTFDPGPRPIEGGDAEREAALRAFLSAKPVLSSQESVLLQRLLVKVSYRYIELLPNGPRSRSP